MSHVTFLKCHTCAIPLPRHRCSVLKRLRFALRLSGSCGERCGLTASGLSKNASKQKPGNEPGHLDLPAFFYGTLRPQKELRKGMSKKPYKSVVLFARSRVCNDSMERYKRQNVGACNDKKAYDFVTAKFRGASCA